MDLHRDDGEVIGATLKAPQTFQTGEIKLSLLFRALMTAPFAYWGLYLLYAQKKSKMSTPKRLAITAIGFTTSVIGAGVLMENGM